MSMMQKLDQLLTTRSGAGIHMRCDPGAGAIELHDYPVTYQVVHD